MVVLQGRTRAQLRTSVGYALGAIYVSSATAQGTTTTLIDTTLLGGDNDYIGWWVVFTSGSNAGTIVRVTDYTSSSGTLTFPAVTQTENNDTYDLWDEAYPPTAIHDFFDQALIDATGHAYDPIENVTLHAGASSRFDIPTGISMLTGVQYRSVSSAEVIPAKVFDESIDGDFTVTLDSEDLLFGRNATKFVIRSPVSAGDLASENIASLDLSRYSHIEFPIKVVTAVASDDLRLILSTTANGASETEAITIPAISARVDTWVRVALANPESDTAIISVALEYNANNRANTVWMGQVAATRADSATWADIPRHLWRIDKEARVLVLDPGAVSLTGYRLLKLVGGDKPALLSSDSTPTEVDGAYLIATATMLALVSAQGGGTHNTPEQRDRLLAYWSQRAERAKSAFGLLVNVRTIS
jgi:hypothetical protein